MASTWNRKILKNMNRGSKALKPDDWRQFRDISSFDDKEHLSHLWPLRPDILMDPGIGYRSSLHKRGASIPSTTLVGSRFSNPPTFRLPWCSIASTNFGGLKCFWFRGCTIVGGVWGGWFRWLSADGCAIWFWDKHESMQGISLVNRNLGTRGGAAETCLLDNSFNAFRAAWATGVSRYLLEVKNDAFVQRKMKNGISQFSVEIKMELKTAEFMKNIVIYFSHYRWISTVARSVQT